MLWLRLGSEAPDCPDACRSKLRVGVGFSLRLHPLCGCGLMASRGTLNLHLLKRLAYVGTADELTMSQQFSFQTG